MKPAQKLTIPHDRNERLHYIKRVFSTATGPDLTGDWVGGRLSGLKKLHSIDVAAYARNRNFLNGAVTHLSPYLRHGCLTLNETFELIKKQFASAADKLLYELAWRDYWRQVWYAEGNAIYSEMEPPKVAIGHMPLANDIMQGKTGLPCMDGFINDLLTTGYVHNHARMWLASYIVHHRKTDWRAAADWFEANLIDGDIASNHLSWQWVASTFSSKPYFFNKENLSRYTGEKYCAQCQAKCPFDADYETLNDRLFNHTLVPVAKKYELNPIPKKAVSGFPAMAVFVHDEMLSAAHALLQQPFPKIFVFDPLIHGTWSLNRMQFIADCLSEMENVEVWFGDTYSVLMSRNVGSVITQDTPNLKIKELLAPFLPKWQPVAKFVNVEISDKRLKRFSRYWEKVGPLVLGDAHN
ncbi:FAD-binding domain-containing protein [Methylotenera sp.]|uniref:FAD-binding domain-containing protein n=1 Tax=Methylotenera sp. TaxID=2051956 RepID=UPI00272F80F5|nr:FAD-binding domain-containing protein [Methylotenera sp.]MDP2070300.1 FAD-binding domain-containing protein [Methylotenera sp.]MDP3005285.1 FAD-binding domain-containing protein [Methylotenera sp.]